jgi:hypothetical protein
MGRKASNSDVVRHFEPTVSKRTRLWLKETDGKRVGSSRNSLYNSQVKKEPLSRIP